VLYFGKPGFAQKFETTFVESVRAKAANPVEAEKKVQEARSSSRCTRIPAINVAMTFLDRCQWGS